MRKYFVFCFLVFYFLAAALPQEFYLATGEELARLKEIWTTSESNRQNWELKARELKSKAETLKKALETLNGSLQTERSTASSLRKSFNEYVIDQSRELSEQDSRIRKLETENEKIKGQRNTLIVGLSAMILLALIHLFLRIRKVFGFP